MISTDGSSTEKHIIAQLRLVMRDDEAQRWLYSPQISLRGEIPRNLIDRGRVAEVLRVVGIIREGAQL